MTTNAEPWSVAGRKFYVYTFHHIDLESGLPPESVPDTGIEFDAASPMSQTCEPLVPAIKDLFKKAGWEGDGKVEIFCIPPFLPPANGADGFVIWHVKQENNGTSWLASEMRLFECENLEAVPAETVWP
jgi:hypothetical protein